mmetsp:Transcript_7645/g.11429  ORF Transcript_7645/g.11429 Transcript_7645/m.11429 type:complete len:225 (-) Transcript_7645:3769-4443(-)
MHHIGADSSESPLPINEVENELFARNEEERFVMVLKRKEKKTGGGGNNEYRCRFCGLKITGGPAKIRAHFLDGVEGGQRVKRCTAPTDPTVAGNNFDAVTFVSNKRKAVEGSTGKKYKKKAKTCGLPQEKLDLHNWIDAEQRCTARRKDGTICGCYYSAHAPREVLPSNTTEHMLSQPYAILPECGYSESSTLEIIDAVHDDESLRKDNFDEQLSSSSSPSIII